MSEPIVIVGGGPVGVVLALALQQNDVPFTMLEARAKGASHQDTRALALSYGSRLILEKLDVWDVLQAKATAINTIHTSQRGGFGRTKLNASEHNQPALGYVLLYGELTQALDAKLDAKQVQYGAEATQIKPGEAFAQVTYNHSSTLSSALIVVADGGKSLGEIDGITRETKEYGHDALVTKVRAELPHNNIAYERFTPQGPMALLPNGQDKNSCEFSLVWTGLQANIHAVYGLDNDSFLSQLHEAFGDRVGKFLSVGKRMCFPLKLSTLKPSTAPHLAVIGNAAQTMHPVAGQGFNVGLRDARTLADLIINTPQTALGSPPMLERYGKQRKRDTRGGILFTDLLVNTFSNDLIGLQAIRGGGLGALNLIKPAKSFLVNKMSFGKSAQNLNADVIVVGAGLVGLAATIAFAKQNKKVVLIGANNSVIEKHQAWDARIYALTLGTETWLKTLDVWQYVDSNRVNPIHAMHLWDESGEKLVLCDDDANLPKLGVIVENQNLMHTLWEQVNVLGVTVIKDASCKFLENMQQHITLILENGTKISAKLLVAADGVHSWVRSQMNIGVKQKSFNQTAIVANFLAEKNHQNIARQWFAPHETLALLPLVGKSVSLVWSVLTERADELLKLSNVELVEKVESQSKHELGALKQFGKTTSFSLNQQTANALIAARVVLVGDAAHQIHPMAGQGVNLGFRDVMQLTTLATELHAMQDIGDSGFLRQYERSRKADIATMNTLTSGLDYLFASDSGMMMKVRSWGLQQLNHQTTIKKLLIHQATV